MATAIITPRNDGPYHVKGEFKIATQGGKPIDVDKDEVWLCRCGHSNNKPFCDGSHKKAAFASDLDEKPPGTATASARGPASRSANPPSARFRIASIALHAKRAMIDAAKSVYLLADSKKFGKREFATFGAIEKIDYLITDTGLEQKYVDWVTGNGIEIIYA